MVRRSITAELADDISTTALDDAFYGTGRLRSGKPGKDGLQRHGTGEPLPFVAWDGEGITYRKGTAQSYVLFGCSTGQHLKSPVLSTEDCLNLILNVERKNPDVIHVGFAFKYDVEMILADLPVRNWYRLRDKGTVRWKNYRLTYHPGKRFTVAQTVDGQRTTATIYDVWGFFQSSFVVALRNWLDADELVEIDRIEAGKKERGNFVWEDLNSYVVPYWQAELRLLVLLVDRLRERLTSADICPSQWHGPGAVASTIYRKHNVHDAMSRTGRDCKDKRDYEIEGLPESVNDAARIAYAGGRFEMLKVGHYNGPVWQYDINSAYPNAISKLPDLARGEWIHQANPEFRNDLFALWHIKFDCWSPERMSFAFPLFYRDERRLVSYPLTVDGWYWTPEASLVSNSNYAEIVEAHIFMPDGDFRPFAFVEEMYAQRKAWKAQGNPAEKALKLALNSLYGKMAQRAGWQESKPLPRFHQLEWAGYVTSYTRAMLFKAMNLAGPHCIAVETDAIFSTKPLPLPVGKRLGQWDLTEHKFITYLQSGTYFTECPTCDGVGCEKCKDSGVKSKYRGLDSDSMTYETAMAWLNDGDWQSPIVGWTTRFIGSGRGLGTPIHRMWLTESKEIRPGCTGKRMHLPQVCPMCAKGISAAQSLHPTCVMTRGGISQPHDLPWLVKNERDPFRKIALEMKYDVWSAA